MGLVGLLRAPGGQDPRLQARPLHALGLIGQWGSGVQRMTAACRDAGLAAPVLEGIATRFRVTLSTERVAPTVLDDADQAILGALAGGNGRFTSEVAKAIGVTPRASRLRLARLVGRGHAREVGAGRQDPGRRYFRAQ